MNKFITFEGGEGTGKSTQCQLLAEFLRKKNQSVITTREPGGTEGAELIRNLLVTGKIERWHVSSEVLLMYAARADHWHRLIKPNLEKGNWILCDRFADSTLAYQGYGHGLDSAFLQTLYNQTVGNIYPERTYIFDLPPTLGLERAQQRLNQNKNFAVQENRFETFEQSFHERVYKGFLEIANNNPLRCYIIDASQSVENIHQQICDDLKTHFLDKANLKEYSFAFPT